METDNQKAGTQGTVTGERGTYGRASLFRYLSDGTTTSCKFFRFLHTMSPHITTDDEKADYVADCHQLIHEARDAANDPARLKPIADAARQLIHEVPTFIPKNGFPNVNNLTYQDSLTAPEIEQRLVEDLKSLALWEWYEELEKGDSTCL